MATELSWWPSPAKLNLFLHITGQRENGYHELQSVFQMLSFGDDVGIQVTNSPRIRIVTPMPGVAEADNLMFRAAQALQQQTQCGLGCDIHIHKKLPMGGGIGGGSSNAATVLRVLNTLWQTDLSTAQLCDIGLSLGADVPVFINGSSVFAEGVGEKFHPLNLPEQWFLVANPGCHVSTAEIFSAAELSRTTPKISPQDYQFESTRNDCENVVINRYPEVANLLQWLVHYAPSRMTGTGACVFSVFESQQEAENVLKKLPKKWSGFVAQGLQHSPLITALNTVCKGLG